MTSSHLVEPHGRRAQVEEGVGRWRRCGGARREHDDAVVVVADVTATSARHRARDVTVA